VKARAYLPSSIIALLLACGDAFPLPDTFDATFPTGTVCAPTNLGGATFSVRFDTCVYRCVAVDINTASVQYYTTCLGTQCEMVLLASAVAHRVEGELGCDARNLENPPAGECTMQSFEFNGINTPGTEGTYRVSIPYLTLDQGEELLERLDAMQEEPRVIIEDVVGFQMHPSRQFQINIAASNPASPTATELTGADCHTIAAP